MKTSPIGYSLAEKLAIAHALDAVILADGTVHNGEINALSELMKRIDFDSNFLVQARNISLNQVLSILDAMTANKKKALGTILIDMAIADGHIHKKENQLIVRIFQAIGLTHKKKPPKNMHS